MPALLDGQTLPLIFAALMGIAILAYVILDGYDLGVGMLMALADRQERDRMVATIGPFWDANETWLVLGIGLLLVAFPTAHGMVLQALYGLSDDQAQFQIQDRLSFMRFLGLGLGDRVPDAKTIWLFREHLTQAKAVENLFARFDRHLSKTGYLAMGGQIVDVEPMERHAFERHW